MPPPIPIAIYLHKRVSPGFALLFDLVFRAANLQAGRSLFEPCFVSDRAGPLRFARGLTIARAGLRLPESGYLLVPPLEFQTGPFAVSARDSAFLRSAHERGLVIATGCLGSFLPAAAGLLDGQEATMHWRWGDYARERFPAVRWNPRALLCESPGVISSGGLFAAIDLALHIISRHAPRKLCRDLGRHLLADSVRQTQSLYATSMTLQSRTPGRFQDLESLIDHRLENPPSVPEMARHCGMSLRSFHRAFAEDYGVTPGKFLQLRRIERARKLLENPKLGIEDIAERCGFRQPAFFRVIFKRETGVSPMRFRRQS